MKFLSIFRMKYNDIYLSDVVIVLGVFISSSIFFSLERSFLLCLLALVVNVSINMKWHLRKRAWFWLILSIFFIGHLILIFSIPMPREFKMAAAFAPVVVVEGLALLGIIGLIERRIGSR